MKAISISAEALFEEHQSTLRWEWIAGHAHPERRFDESAMREARSAADLVGYLNYIHPYRVQLVGHREVVYLRDCPPETQESRIQRIVTLEPPVIIVADGEKAPDKLVAMCDRAEIPLFTTDHSAGHVIDLVRSYLSQLLADRTTRHGVFMDILGLGVLLTGESGLGKSELGLELISRGHGLVADDAVDFARLGPDYIEGRCPVILRNLLEVRGLGLLDIRTIFGETAVRRKLKLRLIVQLVRRTDGEFERLPLEAQHVDVLGVPIRTVKIQVAAGRNLAVLVEAAVRNTILQLRGIDTLKEFIERQRIQMNAEGDSTKSQGRLL